MVELTNEFPSYSLAREVYEVAKSWWLEYNDINPMLPNVDMYLEMMRIGSARCFGCRQDGELVGYAIFGISKSAHSGQVQAQLDTMAFMPSSRGFNSWKFIRFCVEQLKLDGAQDIIMTVPTMRDYSKILTRIGFEEDSTNFVLRV